MAKKNKKTENKSLGRVGRVEREQRLTKIVQYSTAAIIGIVVLVTLGGIILNQFVYPSQPILTINGEEILTRDFQTRVKLERDSLVNEYNLYFQFYYTSQDESLQSQYEYFLSQIQSQLQVDVVGQSVANQMIDEHFIMEEAKARGFEVTEEEITEYMYSLFGYFPDGEPPADEGTELLPTSTLSPTQLALITPTPSPEPVEEEEGTQEEVAPTPAATEEDTMTEEEFKDAYNNYLDRIGDLGANEEFMRDLIRRQLYREKLLDDLGNSLTPQEEQVWARHILVDDEETAKDILQQINDGGDFGDLARQFSTDSSNAPRGGDLGWFGRGMMVAAFEEAAFSGEIGEVVGPVETQFGFHLIQIIGHEMRPISDSQFQSNLQVALTELLNSIKEDAEVEFADGWQTRIPTEPNIMDIQPQQ